MFSFSPPLGYWHTMQLRRPLHQHPQGPRQVVTAVTWSCWSWHCSWKEMFMQPRHSSLVPHFLDSEVGVTGLFSLQESLKDKYIKATALRLGSCPLGKAQHVPGWDGEGSGKFHLASPTSLLPHPLPASAVPPSLPWEHSLCVPYVEGPKEIGTGVNFVGTWRVGFIWRESNSMSDT